MGKRRTRYSSGLAEDWITPSVPEADGPTRAQTSAEGSLIPASGEELSSGPTLLNKDLRPKQVQAEAGDAGKRGRYKKALPSGWVASESENGSGAALGPNTMNIERQKEDYGPRAGQQSVKRSARPAHNIHTSLSPPGDPAFTPPPAPTKRKRMVLPPGKPVHETRSPPIPYHQNSLSRQPRSGHRSYDILGPSQSHVVSPPISLGQSSSAPTDSPSYGRDQPATAPTVSPNYSNC